VIVLFSSGEASGDRYGAAILKEINHLVKGIEAVASGGRALQDAGARLIEDSSHWGAIGIAQSLTKVPQIFPAFFRIKKYLKKNKGIFVAIDFGYLNVKLARYAKAQGWKVLYFVPPGSWKKQARQTELAQTCDALVSPFPWNAEQLKLQGANAFYFGHPLLDTIQFDGSNERSGIALLPGSRLHEIEFNMPVMGKVLQEISPAKIWIPIAQSVDPEHVKKALRKVAPEFVDRTEFVDDAAIAFSKAKAALVCSGSATLEAAICHCPHVIMYVGSPIMNLEYRLLRPKYEHAGMSNILAGARIFPEFIQDQAIPSDIVKSLNLLLKDSPERQKQLDAMQKIYDAALPKGAINETAKLISAWCD